MSCSRHSINCRSTMQYVCTYSLRLCRSVVCVGAICSLSFSSISVQRRNAFSALSGSGCGAFVQNPPRLGLDSGGSWWCPQCNVILRRNALFCDICLRSRSLSENTSPIGSSGTQSAPKVAPGDWQCPYCRKFSSVNSGACCGTPREAPEGYWICSWCSSTNRNARERCLGCGNFPPAIKWKCDICGGLNPTDIFYCETCASAHPFLWGCSLCGAHYHHNITKCRCGGTNPEPPIVLSCPICAAPNREMRKSCFRCRARLSSDEWKCPECHHSNRRNVHRCFHCSTPRFFNMNEVTWVCDVCSTAVASGGDLPERKYCPKCNSFRTSHCLAFPSRWACRHCNLQANRTTSPKCIDCGAKRRASPFRSSVMCPHCFVETLMNEDEKCSHCKESLSDVLSEAGKQVQGMKPTPETSHLP